jgi:hypothetical protein
MVEKINTIYYSENFVKKDIDQSNNFNSFFESGKIFTIRIIQVVIKKEDMLVFCVY